MDANLIAIRNILQSEDWRVFREYIDTRLRNLLRLALAEPGTAGERLSEMRALLELCRGFEIEAAQLEHWLKLEQMTDDDDEAKKRMALSLSSVPRPWRDSS